MTDSLYHRLFSHPLMVEQLVREFVPEAMAVGIDFKRMELVNVKFYARRGRRREGDIIWRLPMHAGPDIYLYFLFEFQSTIDWWMATRIQVYTGLLWQYIIREKKLKVGDRLPALLPIVLYNGNQRWNAPTDLAEMVALPPGSSLWPWQPQVRYYLLDEGAFPGEDLARRDSLAALLFRLEHCREPEELVGLIDKVIGWFRAHPGFGELMKLFTEVVQQAAHGMENQGATVSVPDDLLEVRSMLAMRAQEWKRQWKAEGLAEGLAEGHAEGVTKGLAEGRAEGVTKGKADMLLRQLHRRFGSLSTEVEQRIHAADSDRLDEWMDRLMDAHSLADIFDAQPH